MLLIHSDVDSSDGDDRHVDIIFHNSEDKLACCRNELVKKTMHISFIARHNHSIFESFWCKFGSECVRFSY